jgi:uncharacterized membrane protein (UPF0127 family)
MYINTHINEHIFKTKIVSKPIDLQNGMMGKTFTKKYTAMLFLSKEPLSSFWMKKCIIPLDIIFIKNNVISKIHHNCPPCHSSKSECKRYKGTGDVVLEILGGACKLLNIKKGDVIRFTS